MKSKPPSKKAKLEISGDPPRTASPSGSSTSSLLSIPPPTGGGSASSSSTGVPRGADVLAVAKAITSGVKAQGGLRPPSATTGGPYPTYLHVDMKEWPQLSTLLAIQKGAVDEEGKSKVTLGPEGAMTMDDLDSLQAELETLWSAMACRFRSLKVDQGSLQNAASGGAAAGLGDHFDPHHQEKINAVASLIDAGHGTRTSVSAAAKLVMGAAPGTSGTPSSGPGTGKKGSGGGGGGGKLDKLPKKKLKGEGGSGILKKGAEKPARATQNRSHSISSDLGLDSFYKHEAPSEFWEFADNYCGDMKEEYLEELAKVIEEHKLLPPSLFEIPPLGKHFKEVDAAAAGKPPPKIERPPKRADSCGPLTQRLVAALVEDRVTHHNHQRSNGLGSPKEEASTNGANNQQELGFVHRAGLIKALGLDGGPSRLPNEQQLKECLLERGFLNPEDANDPMLNSDDEVLVELRRTQNTLKKLHSYNCDKLQDLYNQSKKEMDRVPLKTELEQADKEVVEAYKAIASLKQKRKPVTKKEKDAAVKALDNRDKALQKLAPSIKPGSSVGPTASLKVEV